MKSKFKKNILYLALAFFVIFFVGLIIKEFNLNYFFDEIEAKTFDARINITKNKHTPSDKIVVLAIDDDSLEKLTPIYGQYPWARSVYADIIEYLEAQKPDSIAFDLMFVGTQAGKEHHDKKLTEAILKYNNIYPSMNFDYRENEKFIELPDAIKEAPIKNSPIDFEATKYTSVRTILPELLNNSKNVSIINFIRDNDGIARRAPTFIKYNNELYPYLALKISRDYLVRHNPALKKEMILNNRTLKIGDRQIKLDDNGFAILNWSNNDFTTIPIWKVTESINNIKNGEKPVLDNDTFKDKIIYIGVTAVSMYDIKSTPLSKVYPGVKIQTTMVDNILSGNIINKLPEKYGVLLCLLMVFITGVITLRINSTFINSLAVITLGAAYFAFATAVLYYFNIWIGVIYELLAMAVTFTTVYIIKYINKAKDFEYTYKLATTDGLTELYNHRYFQEQMLSNIETCKRYGANFSLILIDIDFFKKFNDTYGHQAGDAVLRQVAALLKKTVRSSDIVARYGGEEMAIILTNTNYEEAVLTAEKICKKTAETMFHLGGGIEKNVTISLGVSTYPMHGEKPSEMIEYSDQCLYVAKENGRNQVGRLTNKENKQEEETKN